MDNRDYSKIAIDNLHLLDELKGILRNQVAITDENNKSKALFINNYLRACLLQYKRLQEV